MDYPERCPKCDADFTGEQIPNEYKHAYSSTHYNRVIGISNWDYVHTWKCPDCGHEWLRERE